MHPDVSVLAAHAVRRDQHLTDRQRAVCRVVNDPGDLLEQLTPEPHLADGRRVAQRDDQVELRACQKSQLSLLECRGRSSVISGTSADHNPVHGDVQGTRARLGFRIATSAALRPPQRAPRVITDLLARPARHGRCQHGPIRRHYGAGCALMVQRRRPRRADEASRLEVSVRNFRSVVKSIVTRPPWSPKSVRSRARVATGNTVTSRPCATSRT